MFVENNTEIDVFEYIPHYDVENCLLKVFPINNHANYQSIVFDVQYITGDINHDSEVSVLDVVLLINIILYDADFNQSADLNDDSIINILDAVILVNLILGID